MTDAPETPDKKPGMFGRLFGGTTKTPSPKPAPANTEPPESGEPGILATPDAISEGGTAASEVIQSQSESISAEPPPALHAAVEQPQQGWFQRLKSGLSKTSSRLTDGIANVLTKRKLDATTLDDLEDLLIQADLGISMATRITDEISSGRFEKGISPDQVRELLAVEIEHVLTPVAKQLQVGNRRKPHVILMVGVNGTGKTTTIGKLAAKFRSEGKSVLLAAGDTFRAAAIEQLQVWGQRTGCEVVSGEIGSDSASLAFDAIQKACAENYDVVMIDTAGRLQNKSELMEELEKVIRVVKKVDPDAPDDVLLVLDATTGQNALSQVEVFRERVGVTGLVMTKLDGTARGGILVAIAAKYGLPVHAIGVGEGVDDLSAFDAREFARAVALG